MNWKSIISDLVEKGGLTVEEIAEETGGKAKTLYALRSGQNKNPYWPLGDELIALHSRIVKQDDDERQKDT